MMTDAKPKRQYVKNGTGTADACTVRLVAIAKLNAPRPVVENTLPTARADPAMKGVPYHMLAMNGADPDRACRLRQITEASKGRV